MSATTWSVDVDGARHTISIERDAQTRRSMIRVDGRMAAKPMADEEEEREVAVGSMRYVVRRTGENQFELDVPPEMFLNRAAAKSRPGAAAEHSSGLGKTIGLGVGALVVVLIVLGLLRTGREGLAYMNVPWQPYEAEDGTFKVLFAGDPTAETETINIDGDLWNVVFLHTRHRNHIYAVEYVDAKMVITERNAPAILERFLTALMSEGKLERKETTSLARNPAISFTAWLPKGAGEGKDRLETNARQRGIIVLRDNRILVAWTLAAERDPITADQEKFLASFEIPPPSDRPRSLADIYAAQPAETAPVVQAAVAPPPVQMPGVEMAAPVARVYVHNKTKKYYPEKCAARPDGAYPIALTLAKSQGFTLAEECAR